MISFLCVCLRVNVVFNQISQHITLLFHDFSDVPLCSIFILSFLFSTVLHNSILIMWFLCCHLVGRCYCLWLGLCAES